MFEFGAYVTLSYYGSRAVHNKGGRSGPFSQASVVKSDGANFAVFVCPSQKQLVSGGVKKPRQFRLGIVTLREIIRYAGSSRSGRARTASAWSWSRPSRDISEPNKGGTKALHPSRISQRIPRDATNCLKFTIGCTKI